MTTLRVKVRRGEGGKGGVMCERQGMAWQCKRKRQGAYGGTAKLPDQTRLRVEGCFSHHAGWHRTGRVSVVGLTWGGVFPGSSAIKKRDSRAESGRLAKEPAARRERILLHCPRSAAAAATSCSLQVGKKVSTSRGFRKERKGKREESSENNQFSSSSSRLLAG